MPLVRDANLYQYASASARLCRLCQRPSRGGTLRGYALMCLTLSRGTKALTSEEVKHMMRRVTHNGSHCT
jgi:hypothetical protein